MEDLVAQEAVLHITLEGIFAYQKGAAWFTELLGLENYLMCIPWGLVRGKGCCIETIPIER
eukprot:scaffold65516_cov19-Tisochrysis_lutea.AAC.1